MRRIRVIPVLGVDQGKLVKTVQFTKPRYIGDPLMAIKIFNDKEVDELIITDIRASVERREPDYALLRNMAEECFMPIGYLGGIRTVDQAKRVFDLGIEKVGISSAFGERPELVGELASRYGSQSIVVAIDVRKSLFSGVRLTGYSATRTFRMDAVQAARTAEEAGAGELVVQAVDREGTFKGYDLQLIASVASAVTIPVVALGGASGISDMAAAIDAGASAVAASSLFVYKRNDVRSILVNYPSQQVLIRDLYRAGRTGSES